MLYFNLDGEMAEWSIASDLKSDELTGSVSSNLTFSFAIPFIPQERTRKNRWKSSSFSSPSLSFHPLLFWRKRRKPLFMRDAKPFFFKKKKESF
jgi:hypothetical protein